VPVLVCCLAVHGGVEAPCHNLFVGLLGLVGEFISLGGGGVAQRCAGVASIGRTVAFAGLLVPLVGGVVLLDEVLALLIADLIPRWVAVCLLAGSYGNGSLETPVCGPPPSRGRRASGAEGRMWRNRRPSARTGLARQPGPPHRLRADPADWRVRLSAHTMPMSPPLAPQVSATDCSLGPVRSPSASSWCPQCTRDSAVNDTPRP
jgi:hypothetical protein